MATSNAVETFRQARFGMFIHWGIYSLMEDGEWVMYNRRIHVKEYEKLAEQFNPDQFNADEWVLTAKNAGMKYIVITAKHHDGFSMFKSETSAYNVVDATPFGRDPLAELSDACRRHGLKIGFYYSHVREWRHPKAQSLEMLGRPDKIGNFGNFWDYPEENEKDLQAYIDDFDLPQLKELLTQYGDVLTIWFDTPSLITPKQGEQIRDYVHSIQTDCLVNSRLSKEIETDFKTMDDCAIPACGLDEAWDTPMTSSESWGYKANDHYRPAGEFIRELCDIASKGGNYLLNVGPDARGVIPAAVAQELAKVGEWLKVNGEAIFDTKPAGLRYRPKWGYATKKGSCFFAIVADEKTDEIKINGLKNRVISCRMLGGEDISFEQNGEGDADRITLKLGGTGSTVRVLALECAGDVQVTEQLMPGDDDSIEMNCVDAKLHQDSPYSRLMLSGGATHQWWEVEDWLEWDFITTEPNVVYDIELMVDVGGFFGVEDFGHEVELVVDGQSYPAVLSKECAGEVIQGRRFMHLGEAAFTQTGLHTAALYPKKIDRTNMIGLAALGIKLIRK